MWLVAAAAAALWASGAAECEQEPGPRSGQRQGFCLQWSPKLNLSYRLPEGVQSRIVWFMACPSDFFRSSGLLSNNQPEQAINHPIRNRTRLLFPAKLPVLL